MGFSLGFCAVFYSIRVYEHLIATTRRQPKPPAAKEDLVKLCAMSAAKSGKQNGKTPKTVAPKPVAPKMVAGKLLVTVMTDAGFNFSALLESTQPIEHVPGVPPLSP